MGILKNNQISTLMKNFGKPSNNSRRIKKNDVFFAIKGLNKDGNDYIDDAIKNGAAAVVKENDNYKKSINTDISIYIVKDSKQSYSIACAESYNNPSNKLDLCGITGTNGKTSVTHLLSEIWKKKGVGIIGTINTSYGKKNIKSSLTTPDAYELNQYLSKMNENKIKKVFMEVSSHSLALSRVEGINFNSAIFTNISHDHLDFHKTMKNYYQSKAKLFLYYLNNSKKKNKLAVINIDDKYGAMIANQTKKNINLITYSTKNKDADFYLKKIIKLDSINRLIIKNKNKELILDTKLFGLYNFQNILASVGFSKNKGLKIEDIYSGVKLFKGAPGRLEKISEKNSNIFIDYAHTPDALKKSIISLKENFKNKKLLILFGCGGDRDKGKRSKMGKIAASLADNIIITSDNPRHEDPNEIIKDIISGINLDQRNKITVISDRRKAIEYSVKKLEKDAQLLVAGKGHEDYQDIKGKKIKFSDKMEIKRCLKK